MTLVRVRQHVNPLSQKYLAAAEPPNWQAIFAKPEQPLHLDIGCARGLFLLEMAIHQPSWNFLGVEIRQPLVDRANQDRDQQQLTNLHYLFCNINPSLRSLLPLQSIQAVTIQFPDPWFKRRHQKRRVVQPALVEALADCLKPGGWILVQSDVLAVAQEMCDRICENAAFTRQSQEWLSENPLPIRTERERTTLEQGMPVYRSQFQRR
jgi:tRNA (guanine-N7-)-methyltransferase